MSKLIQLKKSLGVNQHPGKFWRTFDSSRIECNLCPRHCKISDQLHGFCGVRFNDNGKLVTTNYGVSVEMTQEVIETEAVLHYAPGAPILSLGNIGCMMNCSYCHNWRTSQVKNVNKQDIHIYTPEEVVQRALEKGIKVLSWTYNDPVVWHEFVYDTAKLAKKHGLINLYKSAFYIGPEAIEELHEVIDIFSLSLKSMNPDFYTKVTRGKLQPILDGIKQVYNYKSHHLEISNLVVTGMNDNLEDIKKVCDWVLSNLDDQVPLHLVRFHPDYKYNHVERTSIPFLKQARELALAMGIKHCYLGNVFEAGPWLNTQCGTCKHTLIERFGMKTSITGITEENLCENCNSPSPARGIQKVTIQNHKIKGERNLPNKLQHLWCGDINSGHVIITNTTSEEQFLTYRHLGTNDYAQIRLTPNEKYRFLISRPSDKSLGFEIKASPEVEVNFIEILDRAHFPVQEDSRHERWDSHGHKIRDIAHSPEL